MYKSVVQLCQLSIHNIAQYDVFMLYAYALNDTLAAGEDPRDGNKMRQRLWNRIFEGKIHIQ